jgi:monofunctional biosynthetic peptidoglycan transglycosylase
MMLKGLSDKFLKFLVWFFVASILWVLVYGSVPVRWTPLMLKRSLQNISVQGYENVREWVDIDQVSPVMVRAIIASEDGRFMEHAGFDVKEIIKMADEHQKKGKRIRGCSTISQQVAKNCFTFGGRSWWRKGFEAYYTLLIELLWSKERIMEVYLNVAETGKGLYGVEAASRKFFGRGAKNLTLHQAVSIACVLPDPLRITPTTVSKRYHKKYSVIYDRTIQTKYPF